jgi:hypothetical protein
MEVSETAMTYRGTVKNGVIVIQDAPFLPDGTSVRVEVGIGTDDGK